MNAGELRKAILAANDRPLVAEPVGQWGTTVYLRALSAGDRMDLGEHFGKLNTQGRMARLVSMSVCDSTGARVFAVGVEGDPFKLSEDELALIDKSYEAMSALSDRVRDLNKLGLTAERLVEEKKD